MSNPKWSLGLIREGIERFRVEQGRLPTAKDFDAAPYLPSARQIQRLHGGMSGLREQLGYGAIDYTKGDQRKSIALKAYLDGLAAEDRLEKILVDRFGEPFIHTQKRYGKQTKNRYDFFIYADGICFGVDIFATSRLDYLTPNIRHKVVKYGLNTSARTIFVVAGPCTQADVDASVASITALSNYPHISVMSMETFLEYVSTLTPLVLPQGFTGTRNMEQK